MKKKTIQDIIKKKADGQKITMLTAYDYPFARMVDEAGIDMVLVGDSVAMVVQGLENTLPVTMDEMVYHTRMTKRGVTSALLVGDMPFMSYQAGLSDALRNAARFIKEGGAEAVKIEGGLETVHTVEALTRAEIPVMAHIGLTPQAIHRMGGFRIQGRTEEAANRLIVEAKGMESAGAFAIVLEAVPMELAKRITESVSIPTIGIGAGPHVDGQVLVLYDLLGIFERFLPRFAKRYAHMKEEGIKAIAQFKEEVEKGIFPSGDQSFK